MGWRKKLYMGGKEFFTKKKIGVPEFFFQNDISFEIKIGVGKTTYMKIISPEVIEFEFWLRFKNGQQALNL